MTKSTDEKKSSDKKKYIFLFKSENSRAIKDYLETEDYINGVVNEKGEKVIRSLTEEEKDFMNRFNANFYCGHFFGDETDFIQTGEGRRERWNEKYMRRTDVMNSSGATYRLHEYDDARYARYLDRGFGYEEEDEENDK